MPRTIRPLRLATAVALLACLAPVSAYANPWAHNQVRLRFGIFEPNGESSYWDDVAYDFTSAPGDFEDVTGAVDYQLSLGTMSALTISAGRYEGTDRGVYRDYVDLSGRDIAHDTTLEIVPLTVGFTFFLAPPRSVVRPYAGIGGGVYLWSLEERGDFIDFGTDLEIFRARFSDEGAALGIYGALGLDVRLGDAWGLLLEGRWHDADDELGDDFEGLGTLDLSGAELSAGVRIAF